MPRVLRPRQRVVAPVGPPVRVRQRRHAHPLLAPAAARPVELVGAHVSTRLRGRARGRRARGRSRPRGRACARGRAGAPARSPRCRRSRNSRRAARLGRQAASSRARRSRRIVVVQVARVGVEEGELLLGRAARPGRVASGRRAARCCRRRGTRAPTRRRGTPRSRGCRVFARTDNTGQSWD